MTISTNSISGKQHDSLNKIGVLPFPSPSFVYASTSSTANNTTETNETQEQSSNSSGNATAHEDTDSSDTPSSAQQGNSTTSTAAASSDTPQDSNSTASDNGPETSSDASEEQQSKGTAQEENCADGENACQETSDGNDQVAQQNSTSTNEQQNNADYSQSNSTNAQSTNSTYLGNNTTSDIPDQNSTQVTNENANMTATTNSTSNQNTTSSVPSLPPDFDIDIDPLTMSIEAGSSTTYSITVSSLNGFNATVSLAITSKAMPGITTSLSSNMTKPPTNTSSTLFLNVQSDPDAQGGKYKLKVTASSANMSDSSSSVTLEVIGKNVTLDETEPFDPIAMTPVLIKDMQDNIIDDISRGRMVLISTTVTNNYNKTQPFIVVVEVRDKTEGITLYLQLQKGVLNPLGEAEVAISWIPDKAGTYQVRTFAITELKEDPEPLSAPVGKIAVVK